MPSTLRRVQNRRIEFTPYFLCLLLIACEKPVPPPPDNSKYAKPDLEKPFAPSASNEAVRFTDITASAGIDFVHINGAAGRKWMPETVGGGGGFFDYDCDGRADILLINSGPWPDESSNAPAATSRLYRNIGGGKFEDVTTASAIDQFTLYGMGFCAADYDGDGDADLFVTGVGRSLLLVNENGRYVDQTAVRLRFAEDSRQPGAAADWSLGATWFDADGDGDLDLFVCNYVNWTPTTDIYTTLDGQTKSYATPTVYTGQTNRLFENHGNGDLVEITKRAGLFNPKGKSMGVVVDDFDHDGRADLFVTNDTERNLLYLNRGGTFEEIALTAGCGFDEDGRARAGMGVDTADLTCDGDLCIAIGNFSREPISLYQRMRDNLLFIDAASRARLSRPTVSNLTFGVLFFDANLDGFPDLAAANGHIEPEINRVQSEITFEQAPQLFLNQRDGTFHDATLEAGGDYSKPMVGRAIACADIDGDGDLDLLITNNGGRPRLLRNECINPANSTATTTPVTPCWLRLQLVGTAPNHEAIGAEMRVTAGGKTQSRRIRTGGPYLSQSELTATFGIGGATQANVEITWPNGDKQVMGDVVANRELTITQP